MSPRQPDPRTAGLGRRANLFETAVEDLAATLERDAGALLDTRTAAYRKDILLWAKDILGVSPHTIRWSLNPGYENHEWDGTVDPLAAICEHLAAGENVGAESGIGTGKTYLLAIIAMWFADCWENSQVITVAPKEDQLTYHCWRWISHFFPAFKRRRPRALPGKLRIQLKPPSDEWNIIGFVAGTGADEEVAGRARGFHAKDMLFIFEEMNSIKKPLLTAFELTCVAPHNLRLGVGNPEHQLDGLHLFCTSPDVIDIRASALDHPNVVLHDPTIVEGAVSEKSIALKEAKWGRTGPLYLSGVRGISPAQAADALIRLEWCYQARDRGLKLMELLNVSSLSELITRKDLPLPHDLEGGLGLGVDVANSKAGDEAAIARGRGAICCEIDAFPCPNSNALGSQVAIEMRANLIEPDRVGVDGVGVGAGCVNELFAQRLTVQNLMGGMDEDRMTGEELFVSLRAQMWYQLREDLRFGRIILPDDADLFSDLTIPTWGPKNGKIHVQDKEAIKRLLGRSPNKGDACVYWNWCRNGGGGVSIGGTVISI